MSGDRLTVLLEAVARGETDPAEAAKALAWLPYESLSGDAGVFARVDHHRALRQGQAEVVYGRGKTPEQLVAICRALEARERGFLVTRLQPAGLEALERAFPLAQIGRRAGIVFRPSATPPRPSAAGPVVVLSAGTSDEPVVEEALFSLRAFGDPAREVRDVGVAGLHRLVDQRAAFEGATAAIVVAGMEGALPSVVGGLVDLPVIAVPTSVGYGVALGGLTALFGMLTSCAAGVTVVNIDNGFGAAYAASRIRRRVAAAFDGGAPAATPAAADTGPLAPEPTP
ncbi:MAG: nickel pincer cofactor biosynthesis protein LarB [Gemmatimonadota bacterium]